ncbi:protein FAM91A1-like isoform X3 [Dysidea avara]|uniref:protein FAM91A1-like isoform X3 n=1 Tax=Dysidea avara TaxID=196820 RepID=UPI00331F52A6
MCGFITMLKTGMLRGHMIKLNITRLKKTPTMLPNKISNEVKAQKEEIDEFRHDLKELGIGGMDSEPNTPTDVPDSTQKQEIKSRIVSSSSELDTRPQLDWVPLKMSIGIPLFSGDIYKTVCKKILDYRLFNEDSLEKQIHASRLLALDVMNFIAEYNVPNSEADTVDSHQVVPLLARNLQFEGKTLKNFDIRLNL